MDIRQLTYFVAVAEERTFTAAALRLSIAQSAVSSTVAALERELGTPLLTRGAREVTLTDAGTALLPPAREAIAALGAARSAVDGVVGGLRGTVRIGTLTSTTSQLDLAAWLGDFHRAHPEVHLQLVVSRSGSHGLLDELIRGGLDLAFVGVAGRAPAGVALRALSRDRLRLCVPAEHRLADAAAVAIDQLAGERFVDFPSGYGTRTAVDAAFASAGVEREVVLECTDVRDAADFVIHGLGISVLPEHVAGDRPELHRVALEGPELSWPFSLATPSVRPLPAAVVALVAQLDRYLT